MGLLPRQRGSASQQIAETLGTVDFLLESPGGVSGDVAVVQLLSCVRLFETPIDYTVHGILQVRILEWIAISFSRESSQLRDGTQVFSLKTDYLPSEPPGKPKKPISR